MMAYYIVLFYFFFFHELTRNEVSQKGKPFSTHKLNSGELSRRHMSDYGYIIPALQPGDSEPAER